MKFVTICACIFISGALGAQNLSGEFGFAYNYMAPLGGMSDYIKQGNGIVLDYYLSREGSRFVYGTELSYTIYGHDKSSQLYTFSDGTTANMDIVVDNTITNLLFGARYFLREPAAFRPFITAKAGYAWYRTNLNIYDPDDFDNCEPVDRDVLLKDGTLVISAGAGFQYDLSGMFKKLETNRFIFTLNANLVLGGQVNFMNTDAPTHHAPSKNDVYANFINTQTQVVHKHHVGYVYTSNAELVEIRAGFIFRRLYGSPSSLR